MTPAIVAAIKLLKRTDYFEAQIAKKLSAKFEEHEVAEAIAFLHSKRLLDDRRLAVRFAEKMSGEKLFGPERIRQELLRRGAAAEVAEGCLAVLPPEEEVARKLAAKAPETDLAKQARRLSAAGFSVEAIEAVIEELCAD